MTETLILTWSQRGSWSFMFHQVSVLFTIFHNATVNSQSVHLTSERLQEKSALSCPDVILGDGNSLLHQQHRTENLLKNRKKPKAGQIFWVFSTCNSLAFSTCNSTFSCEPHDPKTSRSLQGPKCSCSLCAGSVHGPGAVFLCLVGILHEAAGSPLCIHDPEHTGPSYPDQG